MPTDFLTGAMGLTPKFSSSASSDGLSRSGDASSPYYGSTGAGNRGFQNNVNFSGTQNNSQDTAQPISTPSLSTWITYGVIGVIVIIAVKMLRK